VAGITSAASALPVPPASPRTSMPGFSRVPPGLSTWTRTRAVRRPPSTTGSMNEMVPANVSPGNDSTVNWRGAPTRSRAISRSYASNWAQTRPSPATRMSLAPPMSHSPCRPASSETTPSAGAEQGVRARRLSRLQDPVHLRAGDTQGQELGRRRLHQVRHPAPLRRPPRLQQLLRRRQDRRAVDVRQTLTAPDRGVLVVHVQPLDLTLGPHHDVVHLRLVVPDGARQPHSPSRSRRSAGQTWIAMSAAARSLTVRRGRSP
jgi:hypothetical protein